MTLELSVKVFKKPSERCLSVPPVCRLNLGVEWTPALRHHDLCV